MRSLILLTLSLPFLATALSLTDLLLPRQAPGTPQYDCHSACGSVIQLARTPSPCETTNFTTSLESCLSCALTFDIWQFYGDSVTEAATACNLPAEPLPANSTSSASSSLSSAISAATTSADASTTDATVSETGSGAPTATGEGSEETASQAETSSAPAETAAASASASETAAAGDDAVKGTANVFLVGLGLLVSWLVL